MATENKPLHEDELTASRKATWSFFLKLSTYTIVGVAIILIGLALITL